jgi:NADPH-dependent ferric siderophore reductase
MVSPTEQSQHSPRKRPRFRTVQVLRVERLAAHMLRVTLGGEELEGFESPTPTRHIKLIVPAPGSDKPVIPDPTATTRERSLMRTYTVRRFDPDSREMDVDFALHGHGPASDWAARAKFGDFVALAGPGGRAYSLELDATWYLLAGDEAALPAMGTVLEALPTSMPVQVYAEVSDAAEQLDLGAGPNTRVNWLHRGADAGRSGELLRTAIGELALPAGPGRVWLACEAGVMRSIRAHLVNDRGLDPGAMVTRGYWKHGEINYPDSDYGEA